MPGARIQLKRALAASWTSTNPVLFAGEVGVETDTRKMKIGDGSTPWSNLQYAKPHIGELSVNDLQDVIVTSASSGQVLKFDGTNWVNSVIQLRVDTNNNWFQSNPTLANGELAFESDTGKIKIGNGAVPYSALGYINPDLVNASINDIGDVLITSASVGQVLKFDGQQWINDSDSTGTTISSIDDINDVVITSASNGQVLQYNGTNWVNAEPTGGTATTTIHPFAMLG